MTMIRKMWLLAFLPGVVSTGCATHTESGAAAGGLLGAATGAIVGSQTGDAGPGAVIGGALGAIGGTLVGAGLDENDRRNEARIAAATAQPAPAPVSVAEIVHMSQSGVSEDVIVTTIRSSHSTFDLSATDVVSLHNSGVSDRVIQAMLDSSRRPAVVQAVPRSVVVERPVYVVDPPPPVAIGFGWHSYPRHRHWRHW